MCYLISRQGQAGSGMKGCWDFVQGAPCCSKSAKCTSGVSFTPVHTYESCRKDVGGPNSLMVIFFISSPIRERSKTLFQGSSQSKVWMYLFHGQFTPTALRYNHEKIVPLKTIFHTCFLVAAAIPEVYIDP